MNYCYKDGSCANTGNYKGLHGNTKGHNRGIVGVLYMSLLNWHISSYIISLL